MKLLLPFLLCILPFCGYAAIRADKPAPVLHSIFDGKAEAAAIIQLRQEAQDATPCFDARTAPPRPRVRRPGHGVVIAGGAMMGFGAAGFLAGRLFLSETSSYNPNQAAVTVAALSIIVMLVGLVLFVVGNIVAAASRKPHAPVKEAVF